MSLFSALTEFVKHSDKFTPITFGVTFPDTLTAKIDVYVGDEFKGTYNNIVEFYTFTDDMSLLYGDIVDVIATPPIEDSEREVSYYTITIKPPEEHNDKNN